MRQASLVILTLMLTPVAEAKVVERDAMGRLPPIAAPSGPSPVDWRASHRGGYALPPAAYYAPPPVYYYAPPPVWYRPPPVVYYAPRPYPYRPHWHHHHHRGHYHWGGHRRW